MTIGTLGSELTFAGQATAALLAARGADGEEVAYFPTMDAVVAAVLDGTIDSGVLTSETSHTACTDTLARILAGEPLFVADEIVVPYRCALLGRPGTRLADVTHVGGHGSIRQCRAFLREELPHATVEQHPQNSVVAAREILAGDGSQAVIGTEALGRALGLETIAADVDRGSLGGWWALTATLLRPEGADVIALRVQGSDALTLALDRAAKYGLTVRTITNAPTGEVFHYRYALVLQTLDGAAVTDQTVAAFDPWVVGVFSTTTVR